MPVANNPSGVEACASLDQENVEANDLENDTHNQQDAEIGRGKNQYSKHVSNSFAGLSYGGYQREFKQ